MLRRVASACVAGSTTVVLVVWAVLPARGEPVLQTAHRYPPDHHLNLQRDRSGIERGEKTAVVMC